MNDGTVRIELTLPSHTRYLALLGRMSEALLEELRAISPEPVVPQRIEVALSEAVSNAILHGNEGQPDADLRVCLTLEPAARLIRIQVWDHGPGFDMNAIPVPRADLKEGGRGLYLIRHIMDSVTSQQTPEGHCLEMTRSFTGQTDA
ncbi:MAG: ATP-binding protein [Candidatus Xenobia bacterium]